MIIAALDLPHALVIIHLKMNLEIKQALSAEKFSSLVPPRNVIMLQHLIIQFSDCLRAVKDKENFKLIALKEVAVAYEWWSFRKFQICCPYKFELKSVALSLTSLSPLSIFATPVLRRLYWLHITEENC